MKLDLTEFPWVGEDFNVVTIDLMMYEEGNYTPLINYMNANDEENEYTSGMTLMTGMSFDSYQAAAMFMGALVKHGFFICPVANTGFVFNNDGHMIDEIMWEELAELETSVPSDAMIH